MDAKFHFEVLENAINPFRPASLPACDANSHGFSQGAKGVECRRWLGFEQISV
jgi:hypothetical protein